MIQWKTEYEIMKEESMNKGPFPPLKLKFLL